MTAQSLSVSTTPTDYGKSNGKISFSLGPLPPIAPGSGAGATLYMYVDNKRVQKGNWSYATSNRSEFTGL